MFSPCTHRLSPNLQSNEGQQHQPFTFPDTLKTLPVGPGCMCGRNSLFIDQADLEARFDAEVVTDGGYTP